MKHTWRAAAAVALLAGCFAAILFLALALLLEVVVAAVHGPDLAAAGKILVLAAVLGLVLRRWWALWRGRAHTTPDGLALAQSDQPRLWAEVFTIADRVDTRAPDEIRLVSGVCARVVEDTRMLGLRPGTKSLHLGVPMLLGVSAEQLRAVVAHELGHHSARHGVLGGLTYRGTEAIQRALADLGPETWAGRLMAGFERIYQAVAGPVNREQELEADKIAAEIAGSRTMIAALKELAPLTEAWEEFVEEYVAPGRLVGLQPEGLFSGFAEFLDDDGRQEWIAGHAARHPTLPRRAHDSHPPMHERVAALRPLSTTRKLDFSGAAEDILDRRDSTFEALEELDFADAELQTASFERVVREGAAARAAQNATAFTREAEQQGHRPVDEHTLLQVLQAGRAAPLMRTIAPEATGAELDRLAIRVVADLVAQRLVDTRRAKFAMSWSQAPLLVDRADGSPLDPWSAATRASRAPDGVAGFEAWLREHGVRLGGRNTTTTPGPATNTARSSPPPTPVTVSVQASAPVPGVGASAPPSAGPPPLGEPIGVLAAAAPISGTTWGTLVVSPVGISLRKVDLAEKAFLRKARARRGASLLGRTVSVPVLELTAHRRTETLSWADITSAEFSGLSDDKGVLTLHVGHGKSRRVEFLQETEIHGDLLGALESLLGPRLRLS